MALLSTNTIRDRVRAALKRESPQELMVVIENQNAEILAIKTAFNTAIAKMNLDAGITDANYVPVP